MKEILILFSLLTISNISAQVIVEETIQYSYDDLNRLIHVIWDDDVEKMYVYDDVSNRIQLQNTGTLGIDEEDLKNTITIYPNPTDKYLSIRMPEDLFSESSEISLYDVNGRLLKLQEFKVENREIRISVDNLSNGVYLLRVKNSNQNWSQLFIKK